MLSSLKNSQVTVPFLSGNVLASYARRGQNNQLYSITLPANVSAIFAIGFSPQNEVNLNGKKVNTSFGVIQLSPGENIIEIKTNTF